MVRALGGPWFCTAAQDRLALLPPSPVSWAKNVGTLEPIQSRNSVGELLAELDEQLDQFYSEPLLLVGHSWGAWLALLYAARFSSKIRSLVLVGAGPLTADYVPWIDARRASRLNAEEQAGFHAAIHALERGRAGLAQAEAMQMLEALTLRTDNYQLLKSQAECQDALPINEAQYASVWAEASALRACGGLMRAAEQLTCPVTVLHGAEDPHPAEGVIVPLQAAGLLPDIHIFPRCGHSPFLETFAADAFFSILRGLL